MICDKSYQIISFVSVFIPQNLLFLTWKVAVIMVWLATIAANMAITKLG